MAEMPQPDNHRRARVVRWTFWAFALVGAYFLVMEHRAHVFEYLPYVLLLACPLLHMFHGHGGHSGHRGGDKSREGA